jgi:hypothetical protein
VTATTITYVDLLTMQHVARRRQIARECAEQMLAYGEANNRPDLVIEATEILATLNGRMS